MTLLRALCLSLLLTGAGSRADAQADPDYFTEVPSLADSLIETAPATPLETDFSPEASPEAIVLPDTATTTAKSVVPEAGLPTLLTSASLAWTPFHDATSVPALALPAATMPTLADTTVSPLDTLRMSPWERVFWGRRGLARVTGLFPTHPDNPVDDLRQIASTRRKMLGLHQTLGLVTVASMAATVVGGQIAINTGNSGFHKATLPLTIGLYSTTAALALLSPPKLVRYEGGGIDSITIHRWLAVGHLAGMVLTPLLAPDGADDATVHQVSGYLTFGTFSAAMLVVTLLRR